MSGGRGPVVFIDARPGRVTRGAWRAGGHARLGVDDDGGGRDWMDFKETAVAAVARTRNYATAEHSTPDTCLDGGGGGGHRKIPQRIFFSFSALLRRHRSRRTERALESAAAASFPRRLVRWLYIYARAYVRRTYGYKHYRGMCDRFTGGFFYAFFFFLSLLLLLSLSLRSFSYATMTWNCRRPVTLQIGFCKVRANSCKLYAKMYSFADVWKSSTVNCVFRFYMYRVKWHYSPPRVSSAILQSAVFSTKPYKTIYFITRLLDNTVGIRVFLRPIELMTV